MQMYERNSVRGVGASEKRAIDMFCHGGTIVAGSSEHNKPQTAMVPVAAQQLSEIHAFHSAGYVALRSGSAGYAALRL